MLVINNYRLPVMILLFLFGLSVGSFLNVVSRRLLRGERVGGRSRCEYCGRKLAWLDLVPLLSFVFLRGRCRYCGAKLSWQYPLVELATGFLFVVLSIFSVRRLVANSSPIAYCLSITALFVASCSLVVIFITDLLEQRVFDAVVWAGILSAFIYQLSTVSYQLLAIVPSLLLAGGTFLFFWLLRVVTHGRGMGEGDPLLGFLCAFLVGFPLGLVMLFIAFTTGAAVGLVLVLLKRKKFGEQVAFGPFLVVATFASIFAGEYFLGWYLGLLGF